MSIFSYLEKVEKHHQSGHATEHTYRGDFAELIKSIVPDVHITNEPSNVTDCGNPDYVITKNRIPVGFIEAKDLGKDLLSKQYKEQFGRYRKALDNLIITDYIWFQFFQNGNLIHEIRIAEIVGKKINPLSENFEQFTNLISDFCTFIAQTIKSSQVLAKMMAAKARLLENILENAITSDEENEDNSSLKQQYETFKNILIHDLTPKGFSDIYAQTLAYGMFAARLHDTSLDTFSRQEAAELIPKSNPFLRKLFSHVAGVDIDERIVTTVDNLADVFRATNVESILKNFGKSTQSQDPIIHFYETFLAEYDQKLREVRGVWYTPKPVVNFIVRGVDEILRSEFNFKDGLADTSKTTIKIKTDKPDRRTKSGYVEIDKEVHKVQVLDPATGTGTFLAEVIDFIHEVKFKNMQGAWSGYVEENLIPRINGFELLMASYSMAHLKLDMLLKETGYIAKNNKRLNVFLTNSLEEHHPDTGTIFSTWLSSEANEANNIKRDTPVMVVLGNPPYSRSSYNKGHWIEELMERYKTTIKNEESQIQALSNDYIKFIRYSQHLIDKNKCGVMFMITGHGYLEGPVTKDMRKSLLDSFDKIYIVDLHGSVRRDFHGSDRDENVFDIQQGVAIIAAIKTSDKSNVLATVNHHSLITSRDEKYTFLNNKSLHNIEWESHVPREPKFDFTPSNSNSLYDSYFSLTDLFGTGSIKRDKEKRWATGFTSQQDKFAISLSPEDCARKIDDLIKSASEEELSNKYRLCSSGQWNYENAKSHLSKTDFRKNIEQVCYRPFDNRYTIYDRNVVTILRGIRSNFKKDNLCLVSSRKANDKNFAHIFAANDLVDKIFIGNKSSTNAYCFPLYIYLDEDAFSEGGPQRIPNLNMKIVDLFSECIDKEFIAEQSEKDGGFSPVDVFDYVYAVLHSPKYREKYNDELKKDFPRIPYPKNNNIFIQLVTFGRELRQIHLMLLNETGRNIANYPNDGSNEITRKINSKDWEVYGDEKQLVRIWINDAQFFDQIPINIWEFYIGGYQPAQKWLKDRVGRKLGFEEITHYQNIIVSLSQTNHVMQEIDGIDFE